MDLFMRFLRSGEEGLPAALGAWSPLSAIGFDAARSTTMISNTSYY